MADETLMDDLEYYRITPTADLISYYRIFSDCPYTEEIAELTEAKRVTREILKNELKNNMYLAVMSEARFKKINICVKDFKNIIEIAVGRSPRDLIFTSDPNISYISTDLPDALLQHKLIMRELMKRYDLERPNLKFISANALDLRQLMDIDKIMPPGKLAMISEGFMIYLPIEEKKMFLENVHKILKKQGGSLVTSDVLIIPQEIITSCKETLDNIAKTTGRDMRDYDFKSAQEAKSFFDELGFVSEIHNPKVDLVSIKKLGLEDDSISQFMASMPVWVLTPKK